MHRLRRSSPIDGEQGSAIILALIVLTVIGAITAASLSYLRTSLAATTIATRPSRISGTSADAAMQTQIAYLRSHPEVGRNLGFTCPASTMTFPGAAGTVTVGVCPEAGSLVPTKTPLAQVPDPRRQRRARPTSPPARRATSSSTATPSRTRRSPPTVRAASSSTKAASGRAGRVPARSWSTRVPSPPSAASPARCRRSVSIRPTRPPSR